MQPLIKYNNPLDNMEPVFAFLTGSIVRRVEGCYATFKNPVDVENK